MPRQPRSLVLRAAGTNCEHETALALERAGAAAEIVHLRALLAAPERLEEFDIFVVPGGFSYGDDVAAGRVLGLQLRRALAAPLRTFVARGGYVLGVCNGFQVLVDTGLLEGPQALGAARRYALTANGSNHYECRWVTLRAEAGSACAWLRDLPPFPVPVAHGEGRFLVEDDAVLRDLERAGRIVLRYVAPDGSPARGYPENPNGSIGDIAGLCDPTGRVVGLMPHPERNLDPWNHPHWTRRGAREEGEGLSFYRRLVEAASVGARAKSARPSACAS